MLIHSRQLMLHTLGFMGSEAGRRFLLKAYISFGHWNV